MTDLLAYWRWDNYVQDLDEGAGFNFNSNQSRLHSAIEIGERLWLVSGRRGAGGIQYLLVACLRVAAKTLNSPEYKYGKYRLWADIKHSAYYSADQADASDILLRLEFQPRSPIQHKQVVGQSLQTIRSLTLTDTTLLTTWTQKLALEKRAYQVADEITLEKSYEAGENSVRETVAAYQTGVSTQRRLSLQNSYSRNRAFVEQLHRLYHGRCQLCGFDPELLYNARACRGHHIVYLSRGGKDEITNMMLVCPNHHEIIHATGAVFDFRDLRYVFPSDRREPLVLNQHLAGVVL